MNWLLYSIIGLVSFSIYDLLSRVVAVNSKNQQALGAVYYSIAALFCLFGFVYFDTPFITLTSFVIIITILSVIIWGFFGRYEYIVHKHVEASTLAIVLKLAPALTFIYAAIILNESVTPAKIIGLIIIISASLWVTIAENPNFHLDRKIRLALLLALILSFGWFIDKIAAPIFGPAFYGFITFISPALANLAPPLPKKTYLQEYKRSHWRLFILALFNVVGYLAMTQALILNEASKVVPIATATTPFVVMLAAIFLKETKNLKIKFLASLLTIVGIMLIS